MIRNQTGSIKQKTTKQKTTQIARHLKSGSAVQKLLQGIGIAGITTAILFQALPSMAYQPPQDARPINRQGTTTSTGTRGDGLVITQLTPKSHIGQTTSRYPTFSWFVAEGTVLPGEFQLYERLEDGTYVQVMGTHHEFVSEPGFMSFTLPSESSGLESNKTYSWQVLLRDPEVPSDIVVQTRSEIEFVDIESVGESISAGETSEFRPATHQRSPMSSSRPQIGLPLQSTSLSQPTLTLQSQTRPAPATEIERLSQRGLWYDALTLAFSLPPAESYTSRSDLLVKLAEIELAATESMPVDNTVEVNRVENLIAHAEGLKEIASLENEERLSSLLMRLR